MYRPKVMLICAMDIKGIWYYEFLDEKETVNATTYLQFMKILWRKLHRNRRHVTWLLDDNARLHRNASVKAWIEEKKFPVGFNLSILPIFRPVIMVAFIY